MLNIKIVGLKCTIKRQHYISLIFDTDASVGSTPHSPLGGSPIPIHLKWTRVYLLAEVERPYEVSSLLVIVYMIEVQK
jgi:hypothetical protein